MTKKNIKNKIVKKSKKVKKTKKIPSWDNIQNLIKDKKYELINVKHQNRKTAIEKIFSEFICKDKNFTLIKPNGKDILPDCSSLNVNIFTKKIASDLQNIEVFILQPFKIKDFNKKELFLIELSGTGIKSNSDIDIDIQYLDTNNKENHIKCIKNLSNVLLNEMKTIPFSYEYDTNFYFSKKFWHSITIKDIKIYYIAIIAKLQIRYLYNSKQNLELFKDNLKLKDSDIDLIKNFYKNKNKNVLDIERNFFKKYAALFLLYLSSKNQSSENLSKILSKMLLFQSESYVFPFTTALSSGKKEKIKHLLSIIKNDKDAIINCYYLVALENLIDCYFQKKPKYLLRAIISLVNIINYYPYNNDNDSDNDNDNIITKIKEYLLCLKSKNKKNISSEVLNILNEVISEQVCSKMCKKLINTSINPETCVLDKFTKNVVEFYVIKPKILELITYILSNLNIEKNNNLNEVVLKLLNK